MDYKYVIYDMNNINKYFEKFLVCLACTVKTRNH